MSRALRTLGVTAALVLVAGLLGIGTASAGETDPAAPTLAVGDCHDLTLAQVEPHSIPVEPVDCTEDHTAVTFAVGTLPSALTWTSSRSRILRAVEATCTPAFDRLIGKNPLQRVRTQYTYAWYAPTDAQKQAGARWFTCHLIVPQDSRLTDLPRTLPKLRKKMPDVVARCAVARSMAFTTCADKHAWRTTYAFYVKRKPTEKAALAAARTTCPQHVKRYRTSIYSWHPLAARKFAVVCYDKTRR